MADDGAYRTRAGVIDKAPGIYRSRSLHGTVTLANYPSSFNSQRIGASHRLYHADYSQCHSAGILFKLFGFGYPATAKLLGVVDLQWRRHHGGVSLAVALSGHYAVVNTFLFEFFR